MLQGLALSEEPLSNERSERDRGRVEVGKPAPYRRREPARTVLYKVVQEHLSTFLERAAERGPGKGLPKYVVGEFERYLDCGILGKGFARVRCPDCGYDTVVGFR